MKAYCTCEKCTGKKLENPVGAMGVLLVNGYSVAAPSDIPYASVLHIDGYGDVVVQDRIPSKSRKMKTKIRYASILATIAKLLNLVRKPQQYPW